MVALLLAVTMGRWLACHIVMVIFAEIDNGVCIQVMLKKTH
jgi:hypothetical protein